MKYCEHPKLKIIIQNKSRYMYKPLWNFALMVTGMIHHTQLGSYCVNIACLYNLVCDWLRTRKSEKLKNTSTSYLLQLILMQQRVRK